MCASAACTVTGQSPAPPFPHGTQSPGLCLALLVSLGVHTGSTMAQPNGPEAVSHGTTRCFAKEGLASRPTALRAVSDRDQQREAGETLDSARSLSCDRTPSRQPRPHQAPVLPVQLFEAAHLRQVLSHFFEIQFPPLKWSWIHHELSNNKSC